jgi:hypothetical protein
MTFRFSFLNNLPAQNAEDARIRFKIQSLSDVYKTLQSRLDGYRQSAGAVFLAVLAAALTIDASFIRFFDPGMLTALHSNPRLASMLTGGAGLLVIVLCVAGYVMIRNLGKYFAEMTSIVYKIDEANQAWEVSAWINGETLYPNNFRLAQDPKHNVSRSPDDPILIGWYDPAIKRFKNITAVIFVAHLFFYGAMLWAVCH